jgi:hypothetical protein
MTSVTTSWENWLMMTRLRMVVFNEEACGNTDQEIFHIVWQEVEYKFDVAEPLMALTLNFINDKLLFVKLFQLVFQLVRVL